MANGLSMVHTLLTLAGAVAALVALVLGIAETMAPSASGRGRRRLARAWRDLGRARWARLPGCVSGWLAALLDGAVRAGFEEVDRHVAFSGMVLSVMTVLVPAAALVNALFGGSPFLIRYYLSLLAAIVLLNFVGESGRWRAVSAVLAAYLGLSLWLVIPIYLVRSFTDAAIHGVFSHVVMNSALLAVFWYIAAHGVGLAIDTAMRIAGRDPAASVAARFVHGVLAALPVTYVLTFVALLIGHFAVFDQSPARSWPLVLAGVGITAVALVLTTRAMAWAAGRGVGGVAAAYAVTVAMAAALSVALAYGVSMGGQRLPTWAGAVNVLIGRAADGGGVYLGPDFWVAHLPFVPVLAFAFAVAAAFVAKAVVAGLRAAAGDEAAGARPFLASALSSGGVAVLLWAAAATL